MQAVQNRSHVLQNAPVHRALQVQHPRRASRADGIESNQCMADEMLMHFSHQKLPLRAGDNTGEMFGSVLGKDIPSVSAANAIGGIGVQSPLYGQCGKAFCVCRDAGRMEGCSFMWDRLVTGIHPSDADL
jgi:hypothetical protein